MCGNEYDGPNFSQLKNYPLTCFFGMQKIQISLQTPSDDIPALYVLNAAESDDYSSVNGLP